MLPSSSCGELGYSEEKALLWFHLMASLLEAFTTVYWFRCMSTPPPRFWFNHIRFLRWFWIDAIEYIRQNCQFLSVHLLFCRIMFLRKACWEFKWTCWNQCVFWERKSVKVLENLWSDFIICHQFTEISSVQTWCTHLHCRPNEMQFSFHCWCISC